MTVPWYSGNHSKVSGKCTSKRAAIFFAKGKVSEFDSPRLHQKHTVLDCDEIVGQGAFLLPGFIGTEKGEYAL